MKAILEFDLPEEAEELKSAQDGNKWQCVVQDFDNELRSKIKYSELSEAELATYEFIRSRLYDLCDQYGITIHE